MVNINNVSSKVRKSHNISSYYLREIGLLLLTVSLLFLPWFQDPSPPEGRPALITGMEFISYGVWHIPLAYILALTAYSISKILRSKWVGVIPFIGVLLVYFNIFINTYYTRFNPPGIPLDRWNGLMDKHFTLSVGMWVNWIGLFALLAGIYYAEKSRRRTAVLFGVVGAVAGFILYIITSALGLWNPEPYFLTSAQAYTFPIIGTIIGSWLVLKKTPIGN